MSISTLRIATFIAALVAATSVGLAAESVKPIKPTANVIELFAAMESGEIEVKVFPKDAKGGNITIKNNTDKPLTIKVPEAFAGVPVLAQGFGGCPGGGGGIGCPGGGGGGGNQGFGGGMMGGGMGGMGMGGMGMGGMGGGFFNVAADKVAKVKFAAVCLDHGKEDPNPRIEYKLIPIDEYAKDPSVTEVIKLMLAGKLDQHSAQAAAWHLQNGLSWEELAKKIGAKHLDGSVEAYFSPVNLQRALAATRIAKERAEKLAESKTVATSAGSEE